MLQKSWQLQPVLHPTCNEYQQQHLPERKVLLLPQARAFQISLTVFDTKDVHFILRTHAILTTASKPDIAIFPSSPPSIAINRKEKPSTIIIFILFLT